MRITEALLLAFDTETTGPNPQEDNIVEIGGVYFRGGEIYGDPLLSQVNPGRYISPTATQVHGIRDEHVENAPKWPVVAEWFKQHLDAAKPLLLGYNLIGFDVPLIHAENARHGVEWELPEYLDGFIWAQWAYRGARSRALKAIALEHKVLLPEERAHRAHDDSIATGLLMLEMVKAGAIPDDCDEALKMQAEVLAIIEAEQARFGRYVYEDRDTKELRIGLGKHTGILLEEAPPEYLSWMGGRPDLPDEARHLVLRLQGKAEQQGFTF